MKYLITIALTLVAFTGCAPRKEIVCQVYFKYDEQGNRYLGFWFIDGQYEIERKFCDKVTPTDSEGATKWDFKTLLLHF